MGRRGTRRRKLGLWVAPGRGGSAGTAARDSGAAVPVRPAGRLLEEEPSEEEHGEPVGEVAAGRTVAAVAAAGPREARGEEAIPLADWVGPDKREEELEDDEGKDVVEVLAGATERHELLPGIPEEEEPPTEPEPLREEWTLGYVVDLMLQRLAREVPEADHEYIAGELEFASRTPATLEKGDRGICAMYDTPPAEDVLAALEAVRETTGGWNLRSEAVLPMPILMERAIGAGGAAQPTHFPGYRGRTVELKLEGVEPGWPPRERLTLPEWESLVEVALRMRKGPRIPGTEGASRESVIISLAYSDEGEVLVVLANSVVAWRVAVALRKRLVVLQGQVVGAIGARWLADTGEVLSPDGAEVVREPGPAGGGASVPEGPAGGRDPEEEEQERAWEEYCRKGQQEIQELMDEGWLQQQEGLEYQRRVPLTNVAVSAVALLMGALTERNRRGTAEQGLGEEGAARLGRAMVIEARAGGCKAAIIMISRLGTRHGKRRKGGGSGFGRSSMRRS